MTVNTVYMYVYRGTDYGMDQVLLPVSEREQDINYGCLQPDSRQRHQWSELLSDVNACSILILSVCFSSNAFVLRISVCDRKRYNLPVIDTHSRSLLNVE